MEELKVNMYVRQDYFGIGKITSSYESTGRTWFNVYFKCYEDGEAHCAICEKSVGFKASHNIVKLIEKDDIILGKDGKIYQCDSVYKDYVFTCSKNENGQIITLVDYQIDKVLTHQQFEMEAYQL